MVTPVRPIATEVAVVAPIVKLVAASSAIEPVDVNVVAPVPVRVAAPAATEKRVVPPVSRFRPNASFVPRVASAPYELPF